MNDLIKVDLIPAGEPYALDQRRGLLYTAARITPCKRVDNEWVEDQSRDAVEILIPPVPVVPIREVE